LSQSRLQQVTVIYNTDYDAELTAKEGVDVSAVEESARAVCTAIADFGFESELIGVHGEDLDQLFRRLIDAPPQLVFNLCESLCGDVRNEPLVPTMLDMLGIPYTGTDPLGLGLCLHKDRTKDVLTTRKVPTPPHLIIEDTAELGDDLDIVFPYFLKLVHEDASIGIEAANVVRDMGQMRDRAAAMIAKHKQGVLAERYIQGREVNVTVWGHDDELDILPLHEIDFGDMPDDRPNIISYAAKWDEEHVDYEGTKPVPMKNLTPELERAIVEVSKAAFRAMGLRDFARVDLRIDPGGQPWVIDVNPNCDLSPDAGVARAARHAGIEYPQLIGRICEIAWRRARSQ
jgi:D-alanine-D-alanine ligase